MSTDGGEPVMRGLLWQLATAPVMIIRSLILEREEAKELAHIHASTQRWLDEQPVTAAQPDTDPLALYGKQATDLQAEVKRLRYALEGADSVLRAWGTENRFLCEELKRRTRERDAARKAITGVSAPLLERTVALGKAGAEIARLQADVVRLTTERDALDDESLAAAKKYNRLLGSLAENGMYDERSGTLIPPNEELKQLRQDLADARQQEQGRPANGATVTLRLENGKTLTGKVHNGMVNGWHTTAAGRSWVPAPDGDA